jgi:hypothetical protein
MLACMDDLPRAPACERNRDPILAVLRTCLADRRHVIEVGSGTGQHAVHFAGGMPWLDWQATDVPANLAGIAAWRAAAALPNLAPPLPLDLARTGWVEDIAPALPAPADAAFSANVVHIVAWPLVASMFEGLGRLLARDATIVLYGPFNLGGRFTAPSNREFDAWLKARDPASGVRDLEAVDALARAAGFTLAGKQPMPANNFTVAWRRGR